MRRRILVSSGIAATAVFVAILALPLQGQSRSTIGAGTPALVITAYNGGPALPYTVPRTPWGDPDLQGIWSSDDATIGRWARVRRRRAAGWTAERSRRPRRAGRRRCSAGVGGRPGDPPPLYLTDEEFEARQKQVADGVEQAEERGRRARSAATSPGGRSGRPRLLVDPPDGVQPQSTAGAREAPAPRDQGTFGDGPFNSAEDFTLYDRCITRGIWGSVMRVVYGNGNRIVQAPGMVAISYEMIHDTRVFYTDGRPHIGSPIRQYLGDSRARWDGDVLVVETTNLTDKTSIGPNGNGLRHSDQMKIVESSSAWRQTSSSTRSRSTTRSPTRAVHGLAAADAARRRRRCCPTTATKATSPCGSRSAPSAQRTRRWQRTWRKGSSANGARCRMDWMSVAVRQAREAQEPADRRRAGRPAAMSNGDRRSLRSTELQLGGLSQYPSFSSVGAYRSTELQLGGL